MRSSSEQSVELMVFFEAEEDRKFAQRKILNLLSLAWNVSENDVEVLSLEDEESLLINAFDDESRADTKLFEMGICDGAFSYPRYVPMMFLSYPTHRRLSRAWTELSRQRP